MNHRLILAASGLTTLLVTACGSGPASGTGGNKAKLDLISMSNGFGLMVPHQIYKPDALGNPTQELIAIRNTDDLVNNLRPANPILPVTEWPVDTSLPNGEQGNHFVYLEFSQELDVNSVLDSSPAGQANSGLTGRIGVLAVDPISGVSEAVVGRAFVGGKTYFGPDPNDPNKLQLQTWIVADASGKPIVNPDTASNPSQKGLGFPGTQGSGFEGDSKLTQSNVFVFVADADGDLTTHETFPVNRQIRIRANTSVTSSKGKTLLRQVLGSSTVGPDLINPEVGIDNGVPKTIPSNGQLNVDPLTDITIEFTEPVQPLSVGPLPSALPPNLSPTISITFGPTVKIVNVPFTALPPSVYDLSTYVLTPAFNFPGSGPDLFQCGTFSTVTVAVVGGHLLDLRANPNSLPASTSFETGEGPGLVNAPVAPDAIYIVRQGALPGISVVDLNGFGQSTGNPTFDFTYHNFPEGNTNFPNNPNLIVLGPVLRPPLAPGSCTVDGGSAGVFTLTKDSSLNDLLVRPPVLSSVGDMALGWALDVVYNNGQEPTGCQSGGGNICAIRGRKNIQIVFANAGGTNYTQPANLPNGAPIAFANQVQGGPNPVSWAPHPNPPPMIFPPLCTAPYIAGDEPTSFEVIQPPPPLSAFGLGLTNLLTPGDPFGNPNSGIPPSGLLTKFQNCYFEGPSPIRPPNVCVDYMYRQQVGHFLYVIDRARREIVVFNSNKFTVLDRISVPDPTDLAMSPNLDFLAITNQNAGSVSFIDINPTSSSFHQIIKTVNVGAGPRGIAWDPGNEDILVCNEAENTLSIISVAALAVRKTVSSQLNQPFDLVILQRSLGFGFFRNVYYAFILNRDGNLAIFESGPSGVNGWGFDDVIGVPTFKFESPKKIALDYKNLGGSVWILHENKLNLDGTQSGIPGGAVTNILVDSAAFGPIPLNINQFLIPQFRDMAFKVNASIGPEGLTGIPIDLALDDLDNFGGCVNYTTPQSAGISVAINGKAVVRPGPTGAPIAAKTPQYMLLAVPNSSEGPGVIDVLDVTKPGFPRVDTNKHVAGTQSVPAAGVNLLVDYFRQ
jgi:lactonase family protein with 7-bladed beta-propeller